MRLAYSSACLFLTACLLLCGGRNATAASFLFQDDEAGKDPPAFQERPRITGVRPAPLTGSIGDQWVTLLGHGFAEDFTVRLQTKGVHAHVTDGPSLDFVNSSQVRVQATFGNEATSWSVQVVNPDSVASNKYPLEIVAPAPQIEVMRPVERTQGASGFALTVYGSTISPHSVIRWNGRDVPTTIQRSSSNPNALATGLRAKIPAALVAEVGRNEVRVFTPPPGGGLSPPMTLFTTARPFYRTPWFYVLFVAGLTLAGFGLHRWRLKNVREKTLEKKVEMRTQRLKQEKEKTEAQTDQLRRQATQLKALDETKNRFLANLSHEFRTPLTLIAGPLRDVLSGARGTADAEACCHLGTAERSARRLEHLIDQLLDLSRLEAGHTTLQPVRADLIDFGEAIVRGLAPAAERRGLTLQFAAAAGPLPADFDPEKLGTVLSNLLSNALKFTPEGGRIVVTAADAGGQALLRVQDTGPGIPAEELPHVFDRFYQVNDAPTREHEGTGIGLSLAKELVELHGGTLRAESTPGRGTTFTVVLPLRETTKAEKAAAEKGKREKGQAERKTEHRVAPPLETEPLLPVGNEREEEAAEGTQTEDAPTVLIVEDNAEVRAYLKKLLAADYHLVEARNGREALERARAARPDLVLSDVMMPGMDGAALCRTLKADAALDDLPVVLLTARAGEAERVEGLNTGADDYVEKPFSADELKARLRNLIASRAGLRQRFSREVVMQPTGLAVAPEDEAYYEQARAVVEEHLADRRFTVGFFADEMNTSKSTLTRTLKAATGLTPACFVRRMRLERAAQLLEAGRNVSEAADAVGYDSAEHFSKIFRDHFGAAPSAYPDDEA